jgi:hypothetical protein
VASSCEYGDELSGSGATELDVFKRRARSESLAR